MGGRFRLPTVPSAEMNVAGRWSAGEKKKKKRGKQHVVVVFLWQVEFGCCDGNICTAD